MDTINGVAAIHPSRRLMAHGFLILLPLHGLLSTGIPVLAQIPTVKVSIDRTIIHVDEIFHVTITLTGPHSDMVLDLKPFTTDFALVGTSQSTHPATIDGRAEVSRKWIITLAPKRLGKSVIPSLEIGDHQSPPIGHGVVVGTRRPERNIRAQRWRR